MPAVKMHSRLRSLIKSLLPYLLAVFAPCTATAEPIPDCSERVQQILNGTLSIGSINNVTIRDPYYMYYGPVHGLDGSYPREDYLALTYEGRSPLSLVPLSPILTFRRLRRHLRRRRHHAQPDTDGPQHSSHVDLSISHTFEPPI